MKRILFILILSAGLLALACNKEEKTNAGAAGTTDTSTSAATTASDTSATTSTTSSAPLNAADTAFVNKAAQGGMAEVAVSQTAATKGTNADVKNFANRMVTDHGKANDELKQLVSNKGVTLPTETDDEHKKAAADLDKKKAGKDYDKAYMSAMVKDHEKVVKAFEDESKSAADPDLKNWVTNTLPTLKDHLKMAKDVAGKVK